jgi:tetratricopeptide (TPR) repeat protein
MNSKQKLSARQLMKEARSLEKSGSFRKAIEKYEALLNNFPQNKEAASRISEINSKENILYHHDNEIGAFDDALKRGDKVLVMEIAKAMVSQKTYNSFVLLHYAKVIAEEEVDKLLKIIAIEINRPTNSKPDKINFLMARYFLEKKKKRFHQAFDTLTFGNSLQYSKNSFQPDKDEASVKMLKSLFSNIDIRKERLKNSSSSKTLIFVVGMPRSGSTLLEQVLCRHNQISSIGEKPFATKFLSIENWQVQKNLNKTLRNLKNFYESNLKQEKVSTNFIIDKMPFNLFWVGFLALAFPRSKFFYTKRDARATFWSNYETPFAEGNPHSFRLEDIVDHYNRCTLLMRFWIDLFPNQIFTFDYEKFVSCPVEYGPQLFDFLGLEWSSSLLEVNNSKTNVMTASQLQVKEKIYSGSSEQWKNFSLRIGTEFSSLIE